MGSTDDYNRFKVTQDTESAGASSDLIPIITVSWPRYLASLRGHVAAVYQIAWSADSRLLVSGSSDSTLKVWDVKGQKLAADLPGHADEVWLAL